MSLISSFDNRTLLSCQMLLAVVFGITFLIIRRANRELRGAGSVASCFLLSIPGIFLLLARPTLPSIASVVIANSLLLISLILVYRGVLRFLGSLRSLAPIYVGTLFTVILVFYFSQIREHIAPRIIALSFTIATIRLLLARELFLHAAGRLTARLFGFSMAFFAFLSFGWGILSLLHGPPADYLQRGVVLTYFLAFSILSTCFTGLFFLSLCHDQILALARAESEIDLLSGTLNRRGIEQRLAIELKRVERSGQMLSAALIDIDYFKAINDNSGHAAGDTALREVVTAISAQLRAYDYLGRYGGDEFLLVLPQTSNADALIVAERVSQAVRSFFASKKGPSITISIGLSAAIPGEQSVSLLGRADQALYEAKHAGRDCTRAVLHRLDIATDESPTPLIDILVPVVKPGLIQP
jgi:diguanylate cyclase (GGDEF)-like protein